MYSICFICWYISPVLDILVPLIWTWQLGFLLGAVWNFISCRSGCVPGIDFIWFLCTLYFVLYRQRSCKHTRYWYLLYMFIVVSILFLSFSIPYWEVSVAIEIHLGSHHLNAVLRIQDVYPGSEFFPSWIPDPNLSSRIPDLGSASKNLSILTPKIVTKLS